MHAGERTTACILGCAVVGGCSVPAFGCPLLLAWPLSYGPVLPPPNPAITQTPVYEPILRPEPTAAPLACTALQKSVEKAQHLPWPSPDCLGQRRFHL